MIKFIHCNTVTLNFLHILESFSNFLICHFPLLVSTLIRTNNGRNIKKLQRTKDIYSLYSTRSTKVPTKGI